MRAAERGFTIIEILIALVMFAIIALGAIAALGVTTASGYLEAFPTSFTVTRTARDYTAAATYLQSLEEYAATQGFNAATAGTYTVNGPATGATCSGALSGVPWTGAPCPENQPFQLNWGTLVITIEQWPWDAGSASYTSTGTGSDSVKLVQATLTWEFGEQSRSVTVKRFLAQCNFFSAGNFCVP